MIRGIGSLVEPSSGTTTKSGMRRSSSKVVNR
jgi:hypothetical protein